MATINKNLLRAIQNDLLTSGNIPKNSELVNDSFDSFHGYSSFDSELSEVKNVSKSLSNMAKIGTTVCFKGGISQDLLCLHVLRSDSVLAIGKDRLRVETQKRIDEIVNVCLPKVDVTYQVARTLCDNAAMGDKSALIEAEHIFTMADLQKRDLQDEALSLFNQENILNRHITYDRLNEQISLKEYSLFLLIFRLSYSFDDVDQLLSRTCSKDLFRHFVANVNNTQKVLELYEILGENTRNSLDNEIMQTLKNSQ